MKNFMNFLNEYVNIKKEELSDDKIININSEEELHNILKEFNIDLSVWETGSYKSVEHLWNEIKEEECIIYNDNTKLKREVNFVGAKIMYKIGDTKYHLKEEKAIFKDGRERIRNIWYSMAEKFKFNEDPQEALIRGMKEELDINILENQTTFYNKVYFPSDEDYPGLKSFHTGYSYIITLNENQYKPEGYIEHQADKDIYFVWEEVKYNGKKNTI